MRNRGTATAPEGPTRDTPSTSGHAAFETNGAGTRFEPGEARSVLPRSPGSANRKATGEAPPPPQDAKRARSDARSRSR